MRTACKMVVNDVIQIHTYWKRGMTELIKKHHTNDGKKEKAVSITMISRLLHHTQEVIIAFHRIEKAEEKIEKLTALSITIKGE